MREDSIIEHFYRGDHELNTLHHNVILNLCEKLFTNSPIPFVPRKGVQLEQELKLMFDELSIGIPVIHIKDALYLVGDQKVHLSVKDTNQTIHNSNRM